MSDDIPELRGTWWARLVCRLVGHRWRDIGTRLYCTRCRLEVWKL